MPGVISDFITFIGTTQWHRVAIVFFVALLGIGMGVGFSTAATEAKRKADDAHAMHLSVFSDWQMEVISKFTRARAIAGSLAAFGMVDATQAANMSASPSDRRGAYGVSVSGGGNSQRHDAFIRLAKDLEREVPGVTSLVLAPGGVASLFYPPGSVPDGHPLSDLPAYRLMFDRIIVSGEPLVTGPTKLTSTAGYAMHVWHPIHVAHPPSLDTFWGAAVAMFEMNDLMRGLNVSTLYSEHAMDYVLWFEDVTADMQRGGDEVIILHSPTANVAAVKADGLRMRLPIGQGKPCYLAMHPSGGALSESMSVTTAVSIAVGTVAIAAFLVLLLYCALLVYFMYRHRNAPSVDGGRSRKGADAVTTVYVAAITLRGAQPIADKAPLEAVAMFAAFIAEVRRLSVRHRCYVVCEIGDRCVYVVGRSADNLMRLAHACAADITISSAPPSSSAAHRSNTRHHGGAGSGAGANVHRQRGDGASSSSHHHHTDTHSTTNRSVSRRRGATTNGTADGRATNDAHTSHHISEIASQSSFMATTICRASAACHAVTNTGRFYDERRDKYFFGDASVLSKLCTALDQTTMGEVIWTEAFDDDCGIIQSLTASTDATLHTIANDGSSGNRNGLLHVACWWQSTGDERDNEDPSTAMAAISDAYVKKMGVLVANGRTEANSNNRQRGGGKSKATAGDGPLAEKTDSSTNKSSEATTITRTATILHVAIPRDARACLEVVRRVVMSEKGVVVNAHDSFIVAAFNLLSPGGHHQLRAAEAAHRLRDALPADVDFVCSIHHGKVTALLLDGIVMCSGDAVTVGRQLMFRAMEMATAVGAAEERGAASPTTIIYDDEDDDDDVNDTNAIMAFSETSAGKKQQKTSHSTTKTTPNRRRHVQQQQQQQQSTNEDDGTRRGFHVLAQPSQYFGEAANGLCIFFCAEEMASLFDCEPVDIVLGVAGSIAGGGNDRQRTRNTRGGGGGGYEEEAYIKDPSPLPPSSISNAASSSDKPRVLYRLAHRRVARGTVGTTPTAAAGEEWLYRVREDEDETRYATVHAIFGRIMAGQSEDAARMWHKFRSQQQQQQQQSDGEGDGRGGGAWSRGGERVSDMAEASLQRIFMMRRDKSSGHTF